MSESKNQDVSGLSGIVMDSLDDASTTGELARRAYSSRTQFHRVFRAAVEETPGAMRRRLLLERAAFQLVHSRNSVTEIALDANYGSLEAFTRAFRKAFRVSPSLFRRMRETDIRLAAPNGIHFYAAATHMKGATDMDLYDRFAGNDSWHTRKLLEAARGLTDKQLDHELNTAVEILPWRESTRTLRQLLENIIFTKEIWTAALDGGEFKNVKGTPLADQSPSKMLERLEKTDNELHRIYLDVRKRGAWDDEFVDALCEPAETFTFGGVFAHIMTFNAHRRILAIEALRSLGTPVEGYGDPMEYEQSISPWAPYEPAQHR